MAMTTTIRQWTPDEYGPAGGHPAAVYLGTRMAAGASAATVRRVAFHLGLLPADVMRVAGRVA